MRAEFKVTLKQTRSQHITRNKNKLRREPMLRQYLVLAYQLKHELEKNPHRTLREISEWLGLTRGRISQILNCLSLSPHIQEEILLSDNKILHQIPEHQVRKIMREVDWNKQQEMWTHLITLN